jgi:hypothetical protein
VSRFLAKRIRHNIQHRFTDLGKRLFDLSFVVVVTWVGAIAASALVGITLTMEVTMAFHVALIGVGTLAVAWRPEVASRPTSAPR